MAVTYKKLWKLLIDKDMKKKDLAEVAGLSQYMMKRLAADDNISTEVIGKICSALGCNSDDIMEFLPDDTQHRL